jgi:3'-phosphoadenosine 5'-phosphosulfate sulfotransferase (PAPS reductase)/FAD synthetase
MPPRAELEKALRQPFEWKLAVARARVEDYYDHFDGHVFVSVSGGKDSTVLADIVEDMYPDVPRVFVDTGVEFPGVRRIGRDLADVVLRPRMKFKDVLREYGYPMINKDQAVALSRYRRTKDPVQKYRRLHGWPGGRKGMISLKWQHLIHSPFPISGDCCDVMKKAPLKKYERATGRAGIVGMMATEGDLRMRQWQKHGCNAFDTKRPRSWPLAYWTDEDVWEYISRFGIDYAEEYDMGYTRTGCVMCGFGLLRDGTPNRFQLLAETHPRIYKWGMDRLGFREVIEYVHPEIVLP